MGTQEFITTAKGFATFRRSSLVAVLLCGVPILPCVAQVPLATPPTPTAGEAPLTPTAGEAPLTPTAGEALSDSPSPLVLPSYRVIPGDILDISVFEKPELSKQLLVPPDGKIQYAFVGEFVAAQLTLGQIKARLTTALSKQLSSPQVSVTILRRQLQEVSILGAVKTPGKRPLTDNKRILDLIVDCGGLSVARPEWVTATLVRGGGAQSIKIDLTKLLESGSPEQNLLLFPGDILLIKEVEQERVSLKVIGEVTNPGNVIVPANGSFAAIITSVNGFKPRASLAKVTLTRDGKAMTVDMREVLTNDKVINLADGTEVKAQPGDQIIISQNKLIYAITGAVLRPGPAEFPETGQVTVMSALSLAGGASENADLKSVVLVRPVPGGEPKATAINLEEVLNKTNVAKNNKEANSKDANKNKDSEKSKAVDLVMLPGDYLYIPSKGISRRQTTNDILQNAVLGFSIFSMVN